MGPNEIMLLRAIRLLVTEKTIHINTCGLAHIQLVYTNTRVHTVFGWMAKTSDTWREKIAFNIWLPDLVNGPKQGWLVTAQTLYLVTSPQLTFRKKSNDVKRLKTLYKNKATPISPVIIFVLLLYIDVELCVFVGHPEKVLNLFHAQLIEI